MWVRALVMVLRGRRRFRKRKWSKGRVLLVPWLGEKKKKKARIFLSKRKKKKDRDGYSTHLGRRCE